ncbi:MAG: hypothetical protein IAG13_35180 [Deltaproteobacteria bacterium]|nr:hypothetical protein [Nannocystaceae bacterium]
MNRDILLAPCLFAGGCLLLVDPPSSAVDDESETETSATGTPVGDGPPVITSLVADQEIFAVHEQITFTVVVEDPDGASEVVRGTLTGSSASTVYGSFVHGDGDQWELVATWTSFADAAMLSVGSLEVWARFEDRDGNVGARKLDLEICGDSYDDERYQECDAGNCVDTRYDNDHCGDCYSYCATDYSCEFGECCGMYGCFAKHHDPSLAASRPIPMPPAAAPLSTLVDEPRPLSGARLERAPVRAFDL